jgi:hypothetical protein
MMNAPHRRLFGLTWVGWLNFLVLRWFFVRIAYEVDQRIGTYLTSAPKGGWATIEIDPSKSKIEPPFVSRWYLARWIWPMRWAAFRFVGRPRGVVRAKEGAAER